MPSADLVLYRPGRTTLTRLSHNFPVEPLHPGFSSPCMGLPRLFCVRRFSSAFSQTLRFYNPPSSPSTAYTSIRHQLQVIPSVLSLSQRAFYTKASLRVNQTRHNFATMASTGEVPVNIQSLSIHSTTEQSKFPNCYPSLNPVDIYREHIAEKLGEATGIEPEKIYTRLLWTNTLDKGDLVLPVCSCPS